jgi:signal transduction histidine kinase
MKDTFNIDILSSIFRICQVPLVFILVFLCAKAILLRKRELFWIALGLYFNLNYIIFGVFSDKNLKIFKSVSIDTLNQFNSASIISDILCTTSFTYALASWYYYTHTPYAGGMILKIKKTIKTGGQTFSLLLVFTMISLFILLLAYQKNYNIDEKFLRILLSGYDFFGLLITTFVFNQLLVGSRIKYYIIIGFIVWACLQLINLIDYSNNKYIILMIGYSTSLIAKSVILLGMFLWYIDAGNKREREMERKERKVQELLAYEETATLFEDILSSTFHEIILPIRSLDQSLNNFNKVTLFRISKDYDDIISNFERVKAIISVSISDYNHGSNNSDIYDINNIYLSKSIISVNTIIEMAIKTIKATFQDINFNYSYASNCYISCNKVELVQVLTNLIKNGIEAYPSDSAAEKEITIKTFNYKNRESNVKKVLIEIEDRGMGVSEKIQEDIWHLGFTTKEKDQTNVIRGNGLALVKKIIERHPDGEIKLESPIIKKEYDGSIKRIQGTKFTISFDRKELPIIANKKNKL